MHLVTARWYALVLLTAIQLEFSKCVVDSGLSDKEETGHSILDTLPRLVQLVELEYHHNLLVDCCGEHLFQLSSN